MCHKAQENLLCAQHFARQWKNNSEQQGPRPSLLGVHSITVTADLEEALCLQV